MHQLPAGPPLSARLSASVRRCLWRFRRLFPGRRILLGLAFSIVLTAIVVGVPVVSGAGDTNTPVALDSSSTSSASRSEPDEPVVVMGVDGRGGATSSSASRADRSGPESAETSAETSTPNTTAAEESPETTGATSSAPGTTPATAGPTGRTTPTASASSPTSSSSSPATSRPSVTPPAPVTPVDLGPQVVALVAQARAEAGCAASEEDPTLADVGRRHSAEMRDHGAPASLDLAAWAVRGAAVGQGTDPAAVVSAWLADPATGATLLDCGSTALGAGTAGPWITLVLA